MFSIKPRVKESTITTGSGPYALSGAMLGYQSFAEIGDGNITEYFCTDNISWEAGLGTLSLAPSQLARTEVMASSNGGSAVNWGAGTKEIFISPLPEMLAHSGLWPLTAAGRFDYQSSTACVLKRYQGKHIPIHTHGVPVYREIPAAGVALSNSGLLPNTRYYAYAYWSGSAIGLEASTTGHAPDAGSGFDVKTGDSTRMLVGQLYIDAAGVFGAPPLTISWYNRQNLSKTKYLSADRSTISTTPVELSPELRNEFVNWANESITAAFSGDANHSISGGVHATEIVLDTAATGFASCSTHTPSAFFRDNVSLSGSIISTEGYHLVNIVVLVSPGTGTWRGSAILDVRVRG